MAVEAGHVLCLSWESVNENRIDKVCQVSDAEILATPINHREPFTRAQCPTNCDLDHSHMIFDSTPVPKNVNSSPCVMVVTKCQEWDMSFGVALQLLNLSQTNTRALGCPHIPELPSSRRRVEPSLQSAVILFRSGQICRQLDPFILLLRNAARASCLIPKSSMGPFRASLFNRNESLQGVRSILENGLLEIGSFFCFGLTLCDQQTMELENEKIR